MSSTHSTVTPLEHTAIGALGGTVEVCIMQPLVGIKNALQEGRPIPKNPAHLYRGLLMNVVSMAPITASQFGTNRLMQTLVLKKSENDLTGVERFGSAAVAGAVSAFIASPSELIIIQQQIPAIGREMLYAAGYLGLFPIIKKSLDERMPGSPGLSLMVAGVTGGVFAAACSHPFDTSKTRMQAFMYSKPEYRNLRRTFATIYKEGGLLHFWKGLSPRMLRIICATFILNALRTHTVEYLDKSRAQAAAEAVV
ncbi:hypothetical protein VOLCADRAFT_97694 [Volvox carteri f. nagariensis]|uniref:Mitochondrial substrate carrier n=1 Tax=Volvox carteri f. nagariensis TaxID=3068 RepID=D8UDE6_VOLCA|nr:uncharacterized protein VOLCADRAFT_97694 [Volvox carteri f. nagariensis]EFJ42250.1 hypothetical protein VOLCADRAFT_97694 [Volvox carteri f. nagariensis]|eukprot:XP_002956648.1 hypothetical protein VOLCADRAFT_97694 [Volvox carteri f. nagariensis]